MTALVRTAKNRALCFLPAPDAGKRRRTYGEKAPAPQAYNQQRVGWQTAQLTVRGRSRRTVYRVEGPFLRRGMAGLPLLLLVGRGQCCPCYGKTKHRAPTSILSTPVGKTVTGNYPLRPPSC